MSAHPLEKTLQYSFTNPALLQAALTHRSYSAVHNERLEFLGDSILDAVIAHELYRRFHDSPEGDLSRLRANLVKQDSLYDVACALRLGEYIHLGDGELKSGGKERPSLLADALEALIGALWLDAGYDTTHKITVALFGKRLDSVTHGELAKDPKTRLQEYLQGKRLPLPSYVLVAIEGKAHAQNFIIACEINALKLRTQGEGSSRRIAEQRAAESALEKLT